MFSAGKRRVKSGAANSLPPGLRLLQAAYGICLEIRNEEELEGQTLLGQSCPLSAPIPEKMLPGRKTEDSAQAGAEKITSRGSAIGTLWFQAQTSAQRRKKFREALRA